VITGPRIASASISNSALPKLRAKGTTFSPTTPPCSSQDRSVPQQQYNDEQREGLEMEHSIWIAENNQNYLLREIPVKVVVVDMINIEFH
jgi:hypothetical protein